MKTRRILAVPGLILASLLLSAFPVYGEATSMTINVRGETVTFRDLVPCTGVTSTITVTFNGVFHVTIDASGGAHFTSTQTGDFMAVGDNGVTYTGHFTIWPGGNFRAVAGGGSVFTVTFSGHGIGSDGSTFGWTSVAHITVNNPFGPPTVVFDKLRCVRD